VLRPLLPPLLPPRPRKNKETPPWQSFFIDRPVFAWVIALFVLLAGVLAIPKLPVSQYPQIAPPTIIVNSIYPGASAQTVDESVTSLIEQEMNGAENMLYIESQSQSDGGSTVSVTFKNGTNPELAAVDVQNRLKRIEARLPQAVVQQGVTITRARSNLLMFVNLISTTGEQSPVALGDYLARNVINEIKRIPGVGVAQLFGTERAMRVWVDPDKLLGFKLTPTDVVNAIKAQNAQFSAGILGDLPAPSKQRIATSIVSLASSPRQKNSATSCCAPRPAAQRCAYGMSAAWKLQVSLMDLPRD